MSSIFEIRPAKIEDALAMARVHVDTWRTTYVGIIPDEYLANLSYERSQAGWCEHFADPQGSTAFVAEVGGQVVALACGGPLREALEDFDGELYVLYILEAYQGMGCGRLLIKRVVHELESLGYHSLVIWVLKENPACQFYERLGGRLAGEKLIEIGGKQLVDAAYVWPNLSILS
jgi:GNAT superfamily N-acetyltransferase